MSVKKSVILTAITLIIFSCSWCMSEAKNQKSFAAAAQRGQRHIISSTQNYINVSRQLTKIVDLSALKLHTTFDQAIEILRHSAKPSLNIIVLWRDLRENALIELDTPIFMQGVSGIQLSKGLELLLRAVSSRSSELGYVIDGGVIVIATKDSLPVRMVARIYDIRDLTAPPANYRFALPAGPFGAGAFGLSQSPIGAFGRALGTYRSAAVPGRSGRRSN